MLAVSETRKQGYKWMVLSPDSKQHPNEIQKREETDGNESNNNNTKDLPPSMSVQVTRL